MKQLAICEMQCKGYSHESFNSSYVYALSRLYKDIEICLFAHSSHIQALKEYWENRGVELPNVSFYEIDFGIYPTKKTKLEYLNIIKSIKEYYIGIDKIKLFCLSINPLFHELISHENFVSCSVVHGGLEELNPKSDKKENFLLVSLNLLKHAEIITFFQFIIRRIKDYEYRNFKKKHSFKNMIEKSDSKTSFIFNSTHIMENLSKFLEVKKNFFCIPLFELFPVEIPLKNHEYPKFAIFGYGAENNRIIELVGKLKKENLKNDYEIKNIGMRHYNDNYSNVHFVQYDKGFLNRKDMEYLLSDVDFFLNFYDEETHLFGCSGSVIESIIYERPVIFTNSPCYHSFNKKGLLGIECKDVDEMFEKISFIINNWDIYKLNRYVQLINNIKQLKKEISIETILPKLQLATKIFKL